MKEFEGKSSWIKTKIKLKQKFAALKDNDLMLLEGQKEKLIARLQIKLGKTKEELRKIIKEL